MKTIKVSETTDKQVTFMVAKCMGHLDDETIIRRLEPDEEGWCIAYSTDWAQGGPIIEQEKLDISFIPEDAPEQSFWIAKTLLPATHRDFWHTGYGTTPLIAAMRCYVSSKLGDEVEIPEELC